MAYYQDSEKIISNISAALGGTILKYFYEHQIEELMLNPDGLLFIQFSSSKQECLGLFDRVKAEHIIRNCASFCDKQINFANPYLECELDFIKARFTAVLPPLVKSPCFCMRSMHALNLSFKELQANGFISSSQKEILIDLIKDRQNLLICGQTSCGKTSFLNSILNTIAQLEPESRLISIEDTSELCLSTQNHLKLLTSKDKTMSDLVKLSLRLSPSRIIVGEIRASEALDMIDAFSTGHSGGIASMHSGSVEQALERLRLLVSQHKNCPPEIERLIALSINVIIVLEKFPYRHVKAIAKLTGFSNQTFEFKYL